MAWSIFQQGGGDNAAVQWAHDFLAALGVDQTPGNVQFVYDWEKSEGGGGKWNPLNQGPVPGHPELTTTGEQYGGGAADFASYQAGIQGAVDYLHMPNYTHVLAALQSDDPNAARGALISSPWASGHYSGGSGFSTAPIPGGAQNMTATNTDFYIPGGDLLLPGVNAAGAAAGAASGAVGGAASEIGKSIVGAVGDAIRPLKKPFESMAVRTALVAFGAVAILVGVATLMKDSENSSPDGVVSTVNSDTEKTAKTAAVAE